MEPPAQTAAAPEIPATHRVAWLGFSGLALAFLGLAMAVFGQSLNAKNKVPSTTPGGDKGNGGNTTISIAIGVKKAEDKAEPEKVAKRGLKDWFPKLDPKKLPPVVLPNPPKPTPHGPPTPAETGGMARILEFASLIGGLLGAALGAGSWIRREDHRVSVSALVCAVIAMSWQWIALGVGVGFGLAVLIVIVSNLS